MKKTLSFIMAVLFVLALFAGCAGSNKTNTTDTTSTPAAATNSAAAATATPAASASPYNFAVGKYKTDSEGWPSAKYEYDLPLSTTGEKFTMWTICWTPQYLPEDGFNGLGMYKGMAKMTGVNMEYSLVSSDTRSQNFSVLVNSDSLLDIMSQGAFYWKSGPLLNAVDDGYFVNFYKYKDYLPNYLYEINSRSKTAADADIKATVFYKPDVWISMQGLFETPIQNTGYMLRQDMMDGLGLGKAEDVKTYDDLHKVLTAFKTGITTKEFYPMMIYNTFEIAAYNWCGYNTTPYSGGLTYVRVADGKVQFCGTTSDDLAVFKLLNQWWKEGLIDPNWSSYAAGSSGIGQAQSNDLLGCAVMTPSTVKGDEALCINPKVKWQPTPRLRQTKDQTIHWGYSSGSPNYGSACFSAKCQNLPLLMTYMDWQYSDSGSLWTNWGPEGELWENDSNGKRMLTEFALKHQAGTAWLQDCFCYNELGDAGIQHWTRNYAYKGGERFVDMFKTWDVSSYYDGSYSWPKAIKFDDQQQDIINKSRTDANTYFTENISKFFTGDTPFSEWDNFVKSMMDMGLSTTVQTYQDAYDAYKKSQKS